MFENKGLIKNFYTNDYTFCYNAGILVKIAAVITGGNGGGKPDIAQAGGKDVNKLDEALEAVKKELI